MSKSKALGTTLTLDDATVGGLKSINGVEISAEAIDVTTLDNQDGYREKLAGLKDGGEVSVSGLLDGDDAGQEAAYSLLESGGEAAVKIKFPAKIGKTWSFTGIVTKFSTGAEVEGAVSFDMSIAVSGKPTLAAST